MFQLNNSFTPYSLGAARNRCIYAEEKKLDRGSLLILMSQETYSKIFHCLLGSSVCLTYE